MGAELGATTSIFPSDENTEEYLRLQGRPDDFVALSADADATYDEVLEVNLSELEPLAAKPHSPDNVDTVKNIGPIKIDQVAIGSCTNSSYTDLMKVALILKGKKVHPDVSLVISPGSSRITSKMAENGALMALINSGARIIENACGPCIGMGQSPKSGAVSLRTFNRNFKGRSGTQDADVYLVSPETAALSAIAGVLTNDAEGSLPPIESVEFTPNDNFIIYPDEREKNEIPVEMGPNIKPFPLNKALEDTLGGKVMLKTGNNITTDDIMPSNAKLLPYRSNVPHLAKFCFEGIDPEFPARCEENNGGIIIGGENYGQGSSREHAALAPLQLGIKFIVTKSFARIHRSNLINSGIIPLTFVHESDYDRIELYDELWIENVIESIKQDTITLQNKTKNESYQVKADLSELELAMILAGGQINYLRS
jgi:aconitate hydratase